MSIFINNELHAGDVVGRHTISTNGDVIIIDGKRLDKSFSGIVELRIEGQVGNVHSDTAVTCGPVLGDVSAGNSARITGDVGGHVKAGNSVECRDVWGKITAGNKVNMREKKSNDDTPETPAPLTFIEQMDQEFRELYLRINMHDAFIEKQIKAAEMNESTIDAFDLALLKSQSFAMKTYAEVLATRISRLR